MEGTVNLYSITLAIKAPALFKDKISLCIFCSMQIHNLLIAVF